MIMQCSVAMAQGPTGTLPIVYVNTASGDSITSAKEYLLASYWVDPCGHADCPAVGSADKPLSLEIRGRGNFTWDYFDKKPYRLRLIKSQPLLGMAKNDSFLLLAHADDNRAFLRNTVGFELSRRIGMPYTPEQRPCELVINGDYRGLYFLTERVELDRQRVNISRPFDRDTTADAARGAWLVEIDNNWNEAQLQFDVEGTDLKMFWITHHAPEELSTVQRDWLDQEFRDVLESIYRPGADSTRWEQHFDLESLTRFYIVNEIVDHIEAFVGSCYMYRDKDEQQWHFGPVWDMGHAFNSTHSKQRFIYDESPFPVSIIKRIATFPRFQAEVRRVWRTFYPAGLDGMETFMLDFLADINAAAEANAQRWPQYESTDLAYSTDKAFKAYREKVAWLANQWSGADTGISDTSVSPVNLQSQSSVRYNLNGQRVGRGYKGVVVSAKNAPRVLTVAD